MVSFLPQLDKTEGASLTGAAFAVAAAAAGTVEEAVLEAAAGALEAIEAGAAVTAVWSRVGTGLALRDATLPLLFPPSTTVLLLVLGLAGSNAALLGLLPLVK